jgi:hypothetical protein
MNFMTRRNTLCPFPVKDAEIGRCNSDAKYNLDALKYRGAIPMINAESLRRSFVAKPERRYLIWGAQS